MTTSSPSGLSTRALLPLLGAVVLLLVVAMQASVVSAASLGGSDNNRYGPKFMYSEEEGASRHTYITMNYGSDGVYKFAFKLPDQAREEERNEEGEVRGSYSFTDPEGEKFSLEYLADKSGFQPKADHLPVAPEETEDVKEARSAFQAFYADTVKYLESMSSGEDSNDGNYNRGSGGYRLGDISGDEDDDEEDSSSSESVEDDDDDDDEESSEEDGDDSSEEDGEESDEDDEDEEDEEDDEEEEEEEEKESKRSGSKRGNDRRVSSKTRGSGEYRQ